ncbi:MAG: restriction endonuclease subunit S [Steroidobacteraceae bacterium]
MSGEWQETTIGAQVRLQRGFDITKLTQSQGRIPVVSTAGVLSYHDTAMAKGPGVILGRKGNGIGRAHFIEEDYWPHDTTLWVTDFKGNDPKFVFYFFRQQYARLQSMDVGSANPTLNRNHVHSIAVNWPPKVEQESIAAMLGALDDKIALNRRMNATLEAMTRALFQSWFVEFDPVRAKLDRRPSIGIDTATAALFPDCLEDSPFGHIPKGWMAGKLGDISTNSKRGVQPCDIAPNTPYIALEHMPRRCIAIENWDDSADVASGKSAFKKGEILFGKLRPYFHKVGVAPLDGVCSTDILVLAPKSPEWFGFLLGHASSDELIQFTDLASTGTKMPRTNWNDICSFKVALPPKIIAAAYARLIQPMLDRIHTNLHQNRALVTLRDALLPKLLSGELRPGSMNPA